MLLTPGTIPYLTRRVGCRQVVGGNVPTVELRAFDKTRTRRWLRTGGLTGISSCNRQRSVRAGSVNAFSSGFEKVVRSSHVLISKC